MGDVRKFLVVITGGSLLMVPSGWRLEIDAAITQHPTGRRVKYSNVWLIVLEEAVEGPVRDAGV